jgi:MoaA/NifB/PqqE/SkfB family radical SAM enzyme
MDTQSANTQQPYDLRSGAEQFPLMLVLSIIYPCNFGCPNCSYTDKNSAIRSFYRERNEELFPVALWEKLAREAGPHGAWMRCTGGGEPMLHPHMVDMIEFAKAQGTRVWLNTNGSMFGPTDKVSDKLRRVLKAGLDLVEFSMDAGDGETYAVVRGRAAGRRAIRRSGRVAPSTTCARRWRFANSSRKTTTRRFRSDGPWIRICTATSRPRSSSHVSGRLSA